jgi:hypothetical protein
MKMNSKPTRIKLLLLSRGLFVLLTALILLFVSSSTSFAPTKIIDDSKFDKTKSINFVEKKIMSDDELSATNAQAFFSIAQTSNQYGSQNVITVNLGVRVDVLAHIDSFKIGYWDNGGNGWDYDITNFYFGGSNQYTSASAVPLVLKGLFLQVGFDNISSSTDRRLNYIDFGTMSASGSITGSLNQLNAMLTTASTGQNNGVMIRQTLGARQTITFTNDRMSFLFASKYNYTDENGHTTTNLRGFFQKIPDTTVDQLGY